MKVANVLKEKKLNVPNLYKTNLKNNKDFVGIGRHRGCDRV